MNRVKNRLKKPRLKNQSNIHRQTELDFIGRNIRHLRRRRGWTIARLAGEIGMAEIPLGRIERGENAPSAAVL